jgi:glucose/arabinose dehydrogenase
MGERRARILPCWFSSAQWLALVAVLVAASAAAQTPPFAVGGDPRVNPNDFRVTVFASGLDFPLSMQALSDGSILVGTSGGLLRLLDADGDGVADGPGTYLYTATPGGVTSLRIAGNLAIAAHGQTISILRRGASPTSPLTLATSFVIQIPFPWSHISFTLAVREIDTNLFELFFNVGSRADDVTTIVTVPVSGAVIGVVNPDSIYRVVVDDTGPSVVVSGLERIASGVRNAFGIAFHPVTGDLYFEDNSIDGPVPPYEVSTDELNRIPAAQIGGPVEDFGFPYNYIAYRTGIEIGGGGIDPIQTFQPIPPPNGVESEGPAEISFAPPGFPAGLREGIFIGFHGKFTLAGLANTDNPVVFIDLGTLAYFHFVESAQPGHGHPDGLLATGSSLFVADFTTVDGFSVPNAGRISQIQYLGGPPAVPGAAPFGIAVLVTLLLITGAGLLHDRLSPG